jgi:hypothetical protein
MIEVIRGGARLLGSLPIAIGLLVAIATLLAWGTLYEARYGTAAVQRVVYQAWWFQALLGFLAVNLAVAAGARWPWQRRHTPFLLAHLGIILILLGGILGGRLGLEGQLVIAEGHAERLLRLPQKVLTIADVREGAAVQVPMAFEARAWVEAPRLPIRTVLAGRPLELMVERYLPDAAVEEHVSDDNAQEHPAIRLRLAHEGRTAELWLFARDPQHFGARVGEAHVMFLEPTSPEQLAELLDPPSSEAPRGVVRLTLQESGRQLDVPVPERLHEPIALDGTPYRLTFREYFTDLAVSEQGVANRSPQPRNPAVALTLAGPSGTDAHLLFAFHPEFGALHGFAPKNPVELRYAWTGRGLLPPRSIGLLRLASGELSAALTDGEGRVERVERVEVGSPYEHEAIGYTFEVTAHWPRARRTERVVARGRQVRQEALLVRAPGAEPAWVLSGEPATLTPGDGQPLRIAYGPAVRELPFAVKLIDFRREDYPGTQMAAAFESDVELSDPGRGLVLMKRISMNKPLRYRGFHLYQASFVEGPVETTVLAVRKDPGTPLVYTGFLIVLAGVVLMFATRGRTQPL